jgi:hypothetical protein
VESGLIVAAALIFKLAAEWERTSAPEWHSSQTCAQSALLSLGNQLKAQTNWEILDLALVVHI